MIKNLLACLLLASTSVLAAPAEFRAEYELYRNQKRLGSSAISLEKQGDSYTFSTVSQSEGGWMSALGGAEINERSEFRMLGEKFQAATYSYQQNVSFKSKKRDIQFDWREKWAKENDGEQEVSYVLEPGAIDRNLVVLALAEDLKAKRELVHPVAYKGEVSEWRFENAGSENVATAMGSIPAEKITRIRANKERSTVSWHAPRFGFLPVKIEQREPNGDVIEMRLKSMRIANAVASTR